MTLKHYLSQTTETFNGLTVKEVLLRAREENEAGLINLADYLTVVENIREGGLLACVAINILVACPYDHLRKGKPNLL